MRSSFFLFFVLFHFSLFAQPGGGGGFHIQHFLHANGTPVLLQDSATFKLRIFFLKGNEIVRETFEHRQLRLPELSQWKNANGLWFRPASDYRWTNENASLIKDCRVFISDGKTEMIIDFLNIPGENGMGRVFRIDSLWLSEGYFEVDLDLKEKSKSYRSQTQSLIVDNGLLVRKTKKISPALFPELHFGKSYLLYRVDDDLERKDTLNAALRMEAYKKKNSGKADCPLSWRLVKYFELKKMYAEALSSLELASYCMPNQYADAEQTYLRKADLQQKHGDYAAAVETYNQLIRIAEYALPYILDREWIRANFLGEVPKALSNLRLEINKIPNDHMQGNWYGLSEYASLYFMLGRIEFLGGEKKSAFRHWRICMQHGYGQTSEPLYIKHFDTLIRKGDTVPELYFCRGIAYFRCSPFNGGGDREKEMLQHAARDFLLAYNKDVGQLNYALFYGMVLNQLNQFESALSVANKMIADAPKDGRGYYLRYMIRHRTGDAKWGNRNDEDYLAYMDLMKGWRFER